MPERGHVNDRADDEDENRGEKDGEPERRECRHDDLLRLRGILVGVGRFGDFVRMRDQRAFLCSSVRSDAERGPCTYGAANFGVYVTERELMMLLPTAEARFSSSLRAAYIRSPEIANSQCSFRTFEALTTTNDAE